MYKSETATLLRVFIGESDKYKGSLLYEEIVLRARELNLLGATVIRAVAGFGSHNIIHTSKILDMFQDLPIIIEIIDKKEKLDQLMPFINETIGGGLITLQDIQIIKNYSN